MNINFGLFPPVEPEPGKDGKRLKGAERGIARKKGLSTRALKDLGVWLDTTGQRSTIGHAV
jgi:methylenetetrahydrofolate--tRNA-(uracil-5-)-methyltransferase